MLTQTIRIGVEVRGVLFGSFLDKVNYCTFFLIKKYQKIKAENHFLEIIFRLAFHATQAVSQVVCLAYWLTRGWLTQYPPRGKPS
jgi:hypothetical protein